MGWRWTARRAGISAFLVAHLAATTLWVIPNCPLRQRTLGVVSYYMMPLGLWQYWTMFAPDPVRDTYMLEAEVVDAKGMRHAFPFPRLAGYTTWQGIPRFRYSKYAANMAADEFDAPRTFAGRHVVRQLRLADEAFPVDVHLFYQVRESSPPGQPPADPMTPTRQVHLATIHFDTPGEVRP